MAANSTKPASHIRGVPFFFFFFCKYGFMCFGSNVKHMQHNRHRLKQPLVYKVWLCLKTVSWAVYIFIYSLWDRKTDLKRYTTWWCEHLASLTHYRHWQLLLENHLIINSGLEQRYSVTQAHLALTADNCLQNRKI